MKKPSLKQRADNAIAKASAGSCVCRIPLPVASRIVRRMKRVQHGASGMGWYHTGRIDGAPYHLQVNFGCRSAQLSATGKTARGGKR